MTRMTYKEACLREEAALKEIRVLHAPVNLADANIRVERNRIMARHLEGTGWTKEELYDEVRKRCKKAHAKMKAAGTLNL